MPPPHLYSPNPLIPSPPHWHQQYPSHRTAPLATGFCGIYSNILTFRLPSLPEQKWFVTAGDGLGRRSFLQHPAFFYPPVLLCRKADFALSFFLLLYSLLLFLSAGADLESSALSFFYGAPQCDRQTGWYSSICWHFVFSVFFVPFARCPPAVWACADTMYWQHRG